MWKVARRALEDGRQTFARMYECGMWNVEVRVREVECTNVECGKVECGMYECTNVRYGCMNVDHDEESRVGD